MTVRLVDLEQFLKSLGTVMRPRMNMSIYNGTFNCACGASHEYGPHIQLLCEGSMRVLMVCPRDGNYLTNVAIKTFMIIKFKGFESLSGFRIETPQDKLLLKLALSDLR